LPGSRIIQKPASCSSWEIFSDDVFGATATSATVSHDSTSKDHSVVASLAKFKESLKDGANNNVDKSMFRFAG
jgi:hypothetical protein